MITQYGMSIGDSEKDIFCSRLVGSVVEMWTKLEVIACMECKRFCKSNQQLDNTTLLARSFP